MTNAACHRKREKTCLCENKVKICQANSNIRLEVFIHKICITRKFFTFSKNIKTFTLIKLSYPFLLIYDTELYVHYVQNPYNRHYILEIFCCCLAGNYINVWEKHRWYFHAHCEKQKQIWQPIMSIMPIYIQSTMSPYDRYYFRLTSMSRSLRDSSLSRVSTFSSRSSFNFNSSSICVMWSWFSAIWAVSSLKYTKYSHSYHTV